MGGVIFLEETHDLVDDAEENGFFFESVTFFINRIVRDVRAKCAGMGIKGCQVTRMIFLDPLGPVATAARP